MACGGALLLLAVVVLIGRFTGLTWLVTIVPDGAPMAFPTVFGFLLTSVAFLAHGNGRNALGRSMAVALLLFGSGTLILYALAEPFGIQRFIYDPVRPVLSRGVGFDGRMSPNAAVSFALVGAGLLMLGARQMHSRLAASCIAALL